MKKTGLLLIGIFLYGCFASPDQKLEIGLTSDHHSLKIAGFDKAILAEISRDSSVEAWQSLLPVYRMPKDTDLKDYQPTQPGTYKIADSLVIFTPDTAFVQGQTYFLRYYQHKEHTSAWEYIRDKKRPGALSHKDLVFKY